MSVLGRRPSLRPGSPNGAKEDRPTVRRRAIHESQGLITLAGTLALSRTEPVRLGSGSARPGPRYRRDAIASASATEPPERQRQGGSNGYPGDGRHEYQDHRPAEIEQLRDRKG